MNIYFDGGCCPNPGIMELAVAIGERDTTYYYDRLHEGTNNEAEWLALLWAMGLAQQRGFGAVVLLGDSQLVINQATGAWRIKHPAMQRYHAEFITMKRQFAGQVAIRYLPRKANLAGHHIEQQQKTRRTGKAHGKT